MVVSTKAIVISKIKYKDNDLIVKCYTAAFGIKSYVIKNALKSKKGKLKPAYFQLLTLLEIEADHKDNRSLHYFKEVRLYKPYDSLHTNILKSTVFSSKTCLSSKPFLGINFSSIISQDV